MIFAVMLGVGVAAGLLERDTELAVLDAALAAARDGTGRVVTVQGPAGIGKTSLLDACQTAAVSAGALVLRALGDEHVMGFPFAAIRELLENEVARGSRELLSGAAGLAASVFADRLDGDLPEQADQVLHGLYWLVANLAERDPVVLLVDDVQWLDAASARFLGYLGRRLESLPVLVVLGTRADTGGAGGAGPASWHRLSDLSSEVLRLDSLSEVATETLIRDGVGRWADEEVCAACHQATGGNPFYLRELITVLRAVPAPARTGIADRVRGLGAGAIAEAVLARLAGLGADCERLSEALAVLAPGSPLRYAAGLAGLDRGRAATAADALRAAALITPGQTLTFEHPIVREAVAATLPASRMAELHGEAARLLEADGAAPDRVAVHLLSSEPYGEPWVVDALRAAAAQARARGAPEAAMAYLRRALAEPPLPKLRLQVLIELGRAQAQQPGMQDFSALHEALEFADDPSARGEIALELGLALVGRAQTQAGRVVIERALADDGALEPDLVHRLEVALIGGCHLDLTGMRHVLERTTANLERVQRGEIADPEMLSVLAMTGVATGLPAGDAAALARRALAGGELMDRAFDRGYVPASVAMVWSGAIPEAAVVLDAGIEEAQRRGSAQVFMLLANFRAATACRAGELTLAEGYAERTYELSREIGVGYLGLIALGVVLLERDAVATALELIAALDFNEQVLHWSPAVVLLAVRGRLRIAAGDLEAGLADLLTADRCATSAGLDLSVQTDWTPAAVSALQGLGRHGEAGQLAEREHRSASAFGEVRRHALALCSCGTLATDDRSLGLLHGAVEMLADGPFRLEQARALLALGAGLRARGERETAREPLLLAMDVARRSGGIMIAKQARAELIATGARPRRELLSGPESLTPAEARAARMAGAGLTNRQIAQALFLSTKTIEAQLSQAYAKLGIRNRAGLSDAFS